MITILRQVYIYKNDDLLYYRHFGKALKEEAFENLMEEIKEDAFGRNPKEIEYHDYYKYRISYTTDQDLNLIFLFVTGLTDDFDNIKKELLRCKKEFLNLFEDILQHRFDAKTFEVFDPTIDSIHKNLRPKITLIGFSGVGKTTITRLIKAEEIPMQHIPTITGDIATIKIGKLHFHLWDNAGQEQFSYLWSKFLKGSDAVLLITDSSLENVEKSKFFLELINESSPNAQVAVIGNKQDLPDAMEPENIERILGIKTYSMIATDPDNRDKMIQIIADILEMNAEVSPLLQPLLERDELTEEAKDALEKGEFNKAALLFEKISDLCIELGDDGLGKEFYKKSQKIKKILKFEEEEEGDEAEGAKKEPEITEMTTEKQSAKVSESVTPPSPKTEQQPPAEPLKSTASQATEPQEPTAPETPTPKPNAPSSPETQQTTAEVPESTTPPSPKTEQQPPTETPKSTASKATEPQEPTAPETPTPEPNAPSSPETQQTTAEVPESTTPPSPKTEQQPPAEPPKSTASQATEPQQPAGPTKEPKKEKIPSLKKKTPTAPQKEQGIKKPEIKDLEKPKAKKIGGLKLNPEDFMVKSKPKKVTSIPKDAKSMFKSSSFEQDKNLEKKAKRKAVSPAKLIKAASQKKPQKPAQTVQKTTKTPPSPNEVAKSPPSQAQEPESITQSSANQAETEEIDPSQKKDLKKTLVSLKIKKTDIENMALDFEMKELSGEITSEELEQKKAKLEAMGEKIEKRISDIQQMLK